MHSLSKTVGIIFYLLFPDLALICMCVAAVFLTNHLLLVLPFHYFLCVCLAPCNLSFEFLHFSVCFIMVLFHWGFWCLCVYMCMLLPLVRGCFSESQSLANCTLRARFLSLYHQGVLFGTSWESERYVRLQSYTRVNCCCCSCYSWGLFGIVLDQN